MADWLSSPWGPNLFEPASDAFWDAIHLERPDLHRVFNPWDRISELDGLRQMLAEAGVQNVDILAETDTHPLNEPEDWWKIAMGGAAIGACWSN